MRRVNRDEFIISNFIQRKNTGILPLVTFATDFDFFLLTNDHFFDIDHLTDDDDID